MGRRAVRRQIASRVRRAQKGRLRLRLARPATFRPSMSRVTFAPQVLPTLHERRRASERPLWTPASVLRDGEVDRLEPICARFQQAVWRLGRQWHGVHRRATPILRSKSVSTRCPRNPVVLAPAAGAHGRPIHTPFQRPPTTSNRSARRRSAAPRPSRPVGRPAARIPVQHVPRPPPGSWAGPGGARGVVGGRPPRRLTEPRRGS